MGDPYSKLYLVCKKFRKVVYLSRTEMIFHISALTNERGMKLKPDLEKVTLSGLCGGQTTSDVQPLINLFDLKFQNNENLVLKGFCLGENFFQLLDSLSHAKLLVLKLVFCDNRTVRWRTEMCSRKNSNSQILWSWVQFRNCFGLSCFCRNNKWISGSC